MCLAIVKLPTAQIPKIFLERAVVMNPHGMGFAYAYENQLIQEKGYFMLDPFITALKKIPKQAKVIIHFRASSGGLINSENCHPFRINEDYTMIHNGMIPNFGDLTDSDTALFTKDILTPLFNRVGMMEGFENPNKNYFLRYLIAGAIGGSRIVILRRDGEHMIVGEKIGHWIKGCWYSNKKSIAPPAPPEPISRIIGFNSFSKLPNLKGLKLVPKTKALPEGATRSITIGHKDDNNMPLAGDLVGSAQ